MFAREVPSCAASASLIGSCISEKGVAKVNEVQKGRVNNSTRLMLANADRPADGC